MRLDSRSVYEVPPANQILTLNDHIHHGEKTEATQ